MFENISDHLLNVPKSTLHNHISAFGLGIQLWSNITWPGRSANAPPKPVTLFAKVGYANHLYFRSYQGHPDYERTPCRDRPANGPDYGQA